MTVLAILPILPALGGLVWVLTAILGMAAALLHPRGWRMWTGFLRSQWRSLAVLAGVGLAAWGAWAWWHRGSTPSQHAAVTMELDGWPMFQGSLTRAGCSGGDGPWQGGVQWTGRPDYEFLGAPAFSSGIVVAIGNRGGAARCFCWDAATGRELWNGGPRDFRQTMSSPVLAEGRIYCGEGVHHTRRARVICLDPARQDPLAWALTTDSHVECTPVVADGRVYVAAGDDGVYCLAARGSPAALVREDGAETTAPQREWHVPGATLPDAETALAVYRGRVYVGLGFKTPALVALDAATGRELRRVELPLPAFAPPTLFDGGLLCGLGPGTLVDAATAGPGELRLVDLQTLEPRWRLPTSASVINAVAVSGDVAIAASADGVVRAVDAGGTVVRTWRAAAPILAAPAVAGNGVYVVSQDGLLTGLDAGTFEPRWSVRLGAPGMYLGSPVAAAGRIFVGTPAGLLCVGRPGTVE